MLEKTSAQSDIRGDKTMSKSTKTENYPTEKIIEEINEARAKEEALDWYQKNAPYQIVVEVNNSGKFFCPSCQFETEYTPRTPDQLKEVKEEKEAFELLRDFLRTNHLHGFAFVRELSCQKCQRLVTVADKESIHY